MIDIEFICSLFAVLIVLITVISVFGVIAFAYYLVSWFKTR